jgi:catechol 2,3-dioxygenase-like lactoylglutathione lyase family enzyme
MKTMFSRGLSELVLIVSDVLRSAAFYRDVVGLTPEREPSEEWAWFWAGEPGVHQRLALHRGSLLFEEHSPHPEGRRWGQVHFALEVPAASLEEAARHVRAVGVEVYGPTHFEWMHANSYYFYDPDGNLIEYWSPEDDAEQGDDGESGSR